MDCLVTSQGTRDRGVPTHTFMKWKKHPEQSISPSGSPVAGARDVGARNPAEIANLFEMLLIVTQFQNRLATVGMIRTSNLHFENHVVDCGDSVVVRQIFLAAARAVGQTRINCLSDALETKHVTAVKCLGFQKQIVADSADELVINGMHASF